DEISEHEGAGADRGDSELLGILGSGRAGNRPRATCDEIGNLVVDSVEMQSDLGIRIGSDALEVGKLIAKMRVGLFYASFEVRLHCLGIQRSAVTEGQV